MMTLQKALEHFKNKASLADALGISKQAVSKWKDDKPIPELQELKLRHEILPNINKDNTAA